MEIIKANKDMTPTDIENLCVDAVLSGKDVAVEITEDQAEKMDFERRR